MSWLVLCRVISGDWLHSWLGRTSCPPAISTVFCPSSGLQDGTSIPVNPTFLERPLTRRLAVSAEAFDCRSTSPSRDFALHLLTDCSVTTGTVSRTSSFLPAVLRQKRMANPTLHMSSSSRQDTSGRHTQGFFTTFHLATASTRSSKS